MMMMKRSVGVLLLFAFGLAQADNVSFELENADSITGYVTLSGSDIVVAQTSYSSDSLTDYEISLSFDYGDGSIDFEVTGGSFVLTNGGTYPSAYFGYGTSLQLSETITDPGETTNWTLEQVENGDISLTLHNLATDDEYISLNPSAGDHIWRLIETRVPTVVIDFLPFNLSGNNNIDPEDDRQVNVAVFTTSIADGDETDFDAAMVDRNTATFGPLQPGKTGAYLTDFDEDLDDDMVLRFANLEVGFLCEDSEAVLEGRTLTGDYFVGADFVVTPLCNFNVCHNDPAPSRDTSRIPQNVVFMATDPADSNRMHLYSAIDSGSLLVRLSPDWPAGFEDADMGGFLISPDKNLVVFARSYLDVAVTGNYVAELFVNSIHGFRLVEVNSNLPSGILDFEWSPDGSSIAYIADEDTNGEHELYVVGIDGTGHVKINGPLPAGGDVFTNGIVWSPDSSQIAYVSDQTTTGQYELWTGAADGSVRVKVSKAPAPGAVDVISPIWSPDGSTIMYMGALDSPGVLELYAVKPDGSDHVTVSGTMVSGGGLIFGGGGHQWSSDSMHILYLADQETDGQNELFVGVADGTSNVKVNGVLGADADVYPGDTSWRWSPDGTRVTYETYDSGTSSFAAYLWTESTGVNTELNAGSETRVLGTAWSPNGQEFAYFSDEVQDNTWQNLYISSADGTSTTKISGTMSTNGGITYVFYSVNGIRTGADGWSPDGSQYLYLADQNVDGVNELFISAADGSSKVKVSEAVATGLGLYYRSQDWSPDGKKVAFVKEAGGTFSLYSNDNVGGTPIKLSGDLDIMQSELITAPPSY